MKNLFLILFAMLSICNIMAQKPFKPLSEFQQDTVAYLEYNYDFDNEALKGKTIGEFLSGSDVEYRVFKFMYGISFETDREIIGIELYLQSYDYIVAKKLYSSGCGIAIYFPVGLIRENSPEIFNEFYSKTMTYYPLNEKNLNFIKNLLIASHYKRKFIMG